MGGFESRRCWFDNGVPGAIAAAGGLSQSLAELVSRTKAGLVYGVLNCRILTPHTCPSNSARFDARKAAEEKSLSA